MTIASTNVKLVPSSLLPKAPNNPLTKMDMVRKSFGNKPLKDLTMERKRVENLKSLLMKIGDESILFFSRVSLSKFSLKALFLSWVKGVFILG